MAKRIRKATDPSAPKPPLNPYLEFAREARPNIILELGNISTPEIGKETGTRWKELDQEEKNKFVQRFQQNKEKYLVDKMNYEKTTTAIPPSFDGVDATMQHQQKKKIKKRRDPLAPKQPLSAFMEFCKEERPKILSDLGSLAMGRAFLMVRIANLGTHAYLSCQKVCIRYALKLKTHIVQIRGSCVGETGRTRKVALIPELPLNPGERF